MSGAPFPVAPLREAMRSALPDHAQATASPREPKFTYVPQSHLKALLPETTIVEGMRGAGKSHWWAALGSETHRKYLASAFPQAGIGGDLEVTQGFGLGLSSQQAPSKDILGQLAERYSSPRTIWRAVLGARVELPPPFPQAGSNWDERTAWVQSNPEDFERLLEAAAAEFAQKGKTRVLLFDALDRMADDWQHIRRLAKGLFQVALDILSIPSIRFKLFIRPDMYRDEEIFSFPDSSKLKAKAASLSWRREDLYALLFQCLANADGEGGKAFRDHARKAFGCTWLGNEDSWRLSGMDEALRKSLFHAITGPYMADGKSGFKRGFPYTWLPNHLVDSHDAVSPRSFIAALRSAVEQELPPNWTFALHHKAIGEGVRVASRIRVDEMIQEDYPWVNALMNPIKGQSVPCPKADILETWKKSGTIESLPGAILDRQVKLLPPSYMLGGEGLLKDLKDLGVISFMSDGRVQMPDVYRVGFGLGRKGGVKPLK